MLAVGSLRATPTRPAFAPRGVGRTDRPTAGRRPEASILAMSRELAMAAALRSTPEAALDRVRPVYRAALHDAGPSRRLTDCLVGGVFHFARIAADSAAPSMVAPIACVATGSYAAGRPEADAGLLLVIEERGALRVRGERVAGLLALLLGELEAGLRTTVRAPADCALLAEALPSFRRTLAQRRFLRGRYALFEALGRAIEERTVRL